MDHGVDGGGDQPGIKVFIYEVSGYYFKTPGLSLKRAGSGVPLGPRILTVSSPGPAPCVLTVNEPLYSSRTPLCTPVPLTRTLLGSGGPFTFTVNGLPAHTRTDHHHHHHHHHHHTRISDPAE